MNEQAIKDAYDLFVSNGYSKDIDNFKTLLSSNPQALNDAFELFKNNGYGKGVDDFKTLMGVSGQDDTLKKKELSDTTESPSEDSSLASASQQPSSAPSVTKTTAAGTSTMTFPAATAQTMPSPKEVEPKTAEQIAAEERFSYMGKTSPAAAAKYVAEKKAKEEEKLVQQDLTEKLKTGSKRDFNESLNAIDAELIDKDEDAIVPQLDYMFKNYGFKFEQAKPGQEAISATAPNGKTITLPVDAFTEKGDLESVAQLKQFIDANKPSIADDEAELRQYQVKIKTDKQRDEVRKSFNTDIESYKTQQKDILSDLAALKADEDAMYEEAQAGRVPDAAKKIAIDMRRDDLNKRIADSEKLKQSLDVKQKDMNASLGAYANMKAQQGGWWGTLARNAAESVTGVTGGIERLKNDLGQAGLNILSHTGEALGLVSSEEAKSFRDDLNTYAKIRQAALDVTKEELPEMVGNLVGTTKEAAQRYTSEEGLIVGAVPMLAQAAAPIVTSMVAPEASIATFALHGFEGAMTEMDNNPNFENVSKAEKYAVAVPIAVATGVLMSANVGAAVGEKGIFDNMVLNALKKSGSETTAATFKEYVSNEVTNGLARGVLTAAPKAASGAAFGSASYITDTGIKQVYNLIKKQNEEYKDVKMFQTPETVGQFFSELGQSAASLAIGDVIMGGYRTLSTAYKDNNFNGITDRQVALFDEVVSKDQELAQAARSTYIGRLQKMIVDKKMTQEQANTELDNFDKAAQLWKQVPNDLSAVQKRKALGLLRERTAIKSSIEGKDPTLVEKQTERIKEINNELKKLPLEPKENAVQEPSTEESVLRAKQPELELPKVGEGDKGTAAEGGEKVTDERAKEKEQVTSRIAEIQKALSEHENALDETGKGTLEEEQRTSLEDELSSLKAKDEAIKLEEMFPERQPSGEAKPVVAVSDTKSMDDLESRLGSEKNDEGVDKSRIIQSARRLSNTLKSILPNFEIHLHEDADSYGDTESRGRFSYGKDENGKYYGRIDINLSNAKAHTVAHEVAHGILLKTFGERPEVFRRFQDKIATILSGESHKRLLDFANDKKYKEQGTTYEEYMAELKALLSDQNIKLKFSTIKGIASVINDFVSKLTNGKIVPFKDISDTKAIMDFINKTASAMSKGEAIGEKVMEAGRKLAEQGKPVEVKNENGIFSYPKGEKPKKIVFLDVDGVLIPMGLQGPAPKEILDEVNRIVEETGADVVISSSHRTGDLQKTKETLKNFGFKYSDRIIGETADNKTEEGNQKDNIHRGNLIDEWKKAFAPDAKIIALDDTELAFNDEQKKYLVNTDIFTGMTPELADKAISMLGKMESKEQRADVSDVSNKIKESGDERSYMSSENKFRAFSKSGLIWHGGESKLKNLDVEKIKGGSRGELGYGFYFSGGSKAHDYGRQMTFLDASNLNLIDGEARLKNTDLLQKLKDYVDYASQIRVRISKLDNLLDKSRNRNEYNEISSEIESLKKELESIDKDSVDYAKKLISDSESSIRDLAVKGSDFQKRAFSKLMTELGYDGIQVSDNWQVSLFPSEKLNGLIVDPNDFTAKKYLESKENNSNPELVKAVEDVIGEPEVVSKEQRAEDATSKAIKAARAQGMSEEGIKEYLRRKGLSDDEIAKRLASEKGAGKRVKLSEETMPGYDAVMDKISNIVSKVVGRVRNERDREAAKQRAFDDAKAYLEGSKLYQDATNVQQEQLIRDLRDRFYKKEKAAPSVKRLFGGLKDVKKVTMPEMSLLKKQILDMAKGAKDAASAIAKATAEIGKSIDSLTKSGKITASQASNLIKRFSKVNPLSPESVSRFTDYAKKVFADADYAKKLSTARETKKSLNRLSKNETKNADFRVVAKEFVKIDPSMVDNIDEYNKAAKALAESIRGSSMRGDSVKFADMVSIADTLDYVTKTLESQKAKESQMMIDEIQELMGVDASQFSYDEMIQLLGRDENGKEKTISKYNESIIRDTLNNMFDTYSALIERIINTGKDAFTGDDVAYTDVEKDTIRKFMDIDINKLSPKEALKAVDALSNFLRNKSIAGMLGTIEDYTGKVKAKEAVDSGIKSKPLKIYNSKRLGRFFTEQLSTIPIAMERLFKSYGMTAEFKSLSGFSKLANSKAMAQHMTRNAINSYVNEFYKLKANGEDFSTQGNVVERGLVSFMSRSVIGTEAQMKKEFQRRKGLIEQSIESLSTGSEQEQTKAKLYQDAYDKILKDAKNFDDVRSKADKNNVKAVDWWIKKWSDSFDELSDVSRGVYNRVLEKDLNYTPDRIVQLAEDKRKNYKEIGDDDMAFHYNNGTIYDKRTGVLMEANNGEDLPQGRYIDLSFDTNNSNAYGDAMIDMKTAANVRRVKAFFNSPEMKKMITSEEDRSLLYGLVQSYVTDMRGKNIINQDEISSMMKTLNAISATGVGQALGGITQPVKQVVPVAFNTLLNAGSLDVSSIFHDAAFKAFIDKSGYAISNRGMETSTALESINKLTTLAANSTPEKALKLIEDANKIWLKVFLEKPDVAIARASWKAYYEKALRKQGIDTKGLDYNTHELNEKAADYAQDMVDRNQNVSDRELMGKLFKSKEPARQLFVKTMMPFANFRVNAAMRAMNDFKILTSKTSPLEEKFTASRSLAAYSVEQAVFKGIAITTAYLLGSAAYSLMGIDEKEEDSEKRLNNIIKGQATGLVNDFLSPVPILDPFVQDASALTLKKVQEAMDIDEKDMLSLYETQKKGIADYMGTFGVTAKRAGELYDISKLAVTGKYVDNYNREQTIPEGNAEALQPFVGLSLLSNIGLAPAEVGSLVRYAQKAAKTGQFVAGTKKQEEKELLQGYDNREDMKRYNPRLYEKTFGENSEYYKEHEQERKEKEIEKKQKQKEKDLEHGYTPSEEEEKEPKESKIKFGQWGHKEKQKESKKDKIQFGKW